MGNIFRPNKERRSLRGRKCVRPVRTTENVSFFFLLKIQRLDILNKNKVLLNYSLLKSFFKKED